jgi:hypothetical protein
VAAVHGLEDAAAGAPEVIDERLTGNTGNSADPATAEGTDLAQLQRGEAVEWTIRLRRRRLLRGCGKGEG